MKRKLYSYIMTLAAVVLVASCAEKMSDEEILAGRDKTTIAVSYSLSGEEVRSVAFTHAAVRKTLDVNVNSDGLKWNLVSDKDWCEVVQEEHCGPGSVTLNIAANEGFEDREPATLTFVAGDYRGFSITVTQSGSSFIIGQPYFVASRSGENFTVTVTTPKDVQWSLENPSWVTIGSQNKSESEETITTELTFAVTENAETSRYASIVVSDGTVQDNIWIYQFGSDLQYDDSGNILVQGTMGAELSLTAPAFKVEDFITPKFTKVSVTDNPDGTSTLKFQFDENFNDCSESRSVELSLLLSNAASTVVPLPAIRQDYIPANGLVTGKGMLAFAQAVAAGTSTADWEENGVVTVKSDIDMSEVTGWQGVGTKDAPFTGKFNGNGYVITNLKNASTGLFGYCQGATIENVIIGKGTSLYRGGAYTGEGGWFGGIVSVAKSTTVSDCEFAADASIDFAGTNDDDEPAYVGAIVGYADQESSVTMSKMRGTFKLSSSTSQMTCYAGGIAGYTEGTLTDNEITGKLVISSGISEVVMGGATSTLTANTVVRSNSFMGTLELGGSSTYVNLGGLYGSISSDRNFDVATDKSTIFGNINIKEYLNSTSTELYVGGFVGKAQQNVALSFKGYECQTNMWMDQTVTRKSAYICLGGVFGGCDPENRCKSVSFENVANDGVYSTDYARVELHPSRAFIGGIVGFVNAENVSFRSCVNNGEIGKVTLGDRGNNKAGYIMVMGGIAAVVHGSQAEFINCENKAPITNMHYSNHGPNGTNGDWYSACSASGILGAFNNKPALKTGTLKMDSCTNNAKMIAYRGLGGGIVGYAINAEIKSCTFTGSFAQTSASNNNSGVKGGIACWLTKSSIKDCIAKTDLFCSNPASAIQSPGGILGIATGGGVVVEDCSYYGSLSVADATLPKSLGGIVSTAEDDTVVRNCRFGGKVNGVDVSENNVADLAVGNKADVDATVTNITLWNGNL